MLFGFDVNLNKQKLPIMKGLPPPVKNKSPTPMSDGVYTIYGELILFVFIVSNSFWHKSLNQFIPDNGF